MHFITCFDDIWLNNQKIFMGDVPWPVDGNGKRERLPHAGQRTFGYFAELERALLAVSRNEMDMNEMRYTWLVVEKLSEGIHAMNDERFEHWFKWDWNRRLWLATVRPEALRDIAGGFALG